MCISLINFFMNFNFLIDFLSKGSLFIQFNPGFNFFEFLFPFKNTWAFLDYIWASMLSNKINTFIIFLVLFLGFILMCWTAREVMTWFLQTKRIAKQNQLLIKQNKVLMGKVEAINITLRNTRPHSLFTTNEREADISDMGQKTSLISDIDDPLIDIHDSSDSLPKESSLDT